MRACVEQWRFALAERGIVMFPAAERALRLLGGVDLAMVPRALRGPFTTEFHPLRAGGPRMLAHVADVLGSRVFPLGPDHDADVVITESGEVWLYDGQFLRVGVDLESAVERMCHEGEYPAMTEAEVRSFRGTSR